MAVPTPPTRSTLIAEGYKKANQLNPSVAALARADTEWMNEIVNEVMIAATKYGVKLRSLLATKFIVTVAGISSYAFPSDYLSDLSITLMDGNTRGVATGGAAGSVTLAAAETLTAEDALGSRIVMLSGTSALESSQIYSYDATTKIALISPSFGVTAIAGDGYLVVSANYDLESRAIRVKDALYSDALVQRPYQYSALANNTTGKFDLYPVPDIVYPMMLRYHADLSLLDATGTLANTLYNRWRNLFVYGIAMRCLQDKSDARALKLQKDYEGMIMMILDQEAGGREQDSMTVSPDWR